MEVDSNMNSKNDSGVNEVSSHLEKIKENIVFFLGFGGIAFILFNFHYAVMKIRENEYYGVNTDLIDEGILIDGVRNYLSFILISIGIIGIYIALLNLFIKKKRTHVKDYPSEYNYFYLILVSIIIIAIYIIVHITAGYKNEPPDTISAFLVLAILNIIHVIITSITFFKTVIKSNDYSFWDLTTFLHFGYAIAFFFFMLLPFLYINDKIEHSDSITMTTNKDFVLVDKDKKQIILRKTKDLKKGKYTFLDEYKSIDINTLKNDMILKKFEIDDDISYEKKGFIKIVKKE